MENRNLFCKKCNMSVLESDALEAKGQHFCPVCKRALNFFGSEEAKLSKPEKFSQYDEQTSQEERAQFSSKNVVFVQPLVDSQVLQCEDMLKFDPSNLDALLHLGKHYLRNNNLDRCKEYFTRLNTLAPGFTETYQILADYYYGSSEPEKALEQLAIISKIEPMNYFVYYNMGRAYYKMNDLKSAISSFNNAHGKCMDYKKREEIEALVKTLAAERKAQLKNTSQTKE